jgi:hypothetical protein
MCSRAAAPTEPLRATVRSVTYPIGLPTAGRIGLPGDGGFLTD